jgi:hypothetical protein
MALAETPRSESPFTGPMAPSRLNAAGTVLVKGVSYLMRMSAALGVRHADAPSRADV